MYSLTISGPHFLEMRQLLRPPNGHESGLLMLLGVADVAADPWIGAVSYTHLTLPTILRV